MPPMEELVSWMLIIYNPTDRVFSILGVIYHLSMAIYLKYKLGRTTGIILNWSGYSMLSGLTCIEQTPDKTGFQALSYKIIN